MVNKILDIIKAYKGWFIFALLITVMGIVYKTTGKLLFDWIFGEDNQAVGAATLVLGIILFIFIVYRTIEAFINQYKENHNEKS